MVGQFDTQGETKTRQQLWFFGERRKWKWKDRLMTRWGMVTLTLPGDRTYVMCCGLYSPPAIVAGLDQATTFLSFYCIYSSWSGWMDEQTWWCLAGKMLHSIQLSLHLRYWKTKQIRNVQLYQFLALFGIFYFFIFLLYAAKIQKIPADMQETHMVKFWWLTAGCAALKWT